MRSQLILSFVLICTVPLCAQVERQSVQQPGGGDSADMLLPPPVSGQAYSMQYLSEQSSNYLRGRMSFNTSYIDNLYAGSSEASVSETTLSVLPTISLNRTSSLQHLTLTYSPGFTFYQPTSSLNEIDQSAVLDFQRNLSPHSTLTLHDGFEDSSTSFGYINLGTGGVQGIPISVTPGIIPPFAQRLSNVATAEFTLQTARNSMVGGSGTVTLVNYPNPSQTTGLFDGTARGGSAFYSHRLTGNQYTGVAYQYMDMLTNPSGTLESDSQTHDFSAFYTIYLASDVPLSVVAGPQYYHVKESSLPSYSSWTPAFAASIGWQGDYASYALSYSQSVTGAGGLLGAFHTKSATAAIRWQVAPTWSAGVSGAYANNHAVNSSIITNGENGHTLMGSISVEHQIGEQLGIRFQYDHLHASYAGIPSFLNNPDSNRGTVSLWWQFTRPLGR